MKILRVALTTFCILGLAGCAEDNEAAMREQAARAKGTIPGSRTAQAQTQEEYYEITPGVHGAGSQSGPLPDQGAGYPAARSAASGNAMWRMAMPRPGQGSSSAVEKK